MCRAGNDVRGRGAATANGNRRRGIRGGVNVPLTSGGDSRARPCRSRSPACRLWVELSRADGEPRTAEVWDGDGELIHVVDWPRDITLANPDWVGSNSALGIRRDSLGVENVVRLSF